MADLSGLWSLGSSVINAFSQGQTNQANDQRQQRQNEYNFRMWELNNQYNDPSAQMKRLERAGLNPNLIYGQNAQGASGFSSSPAQGVNPFQAQSPVQTDPLMVAQLELLKAQKFKTLEEGKGQSIENNIIDLTGLQKALQELQYGSVEIGYISQKTSNLQAEYDNLKETRLNIQKAREQMDVNIQKTLQETQNLKAEEATEQQALLLLIAQTEGQNLSNEQQRIVNEFLPKKMRQEIAEGYKRMQLMDKEIESMDYDNAYTFSQTLLVDEQTKTEKERRVNIKADTRKKTAEAIGTEIDNKTRNVRNYVAIAKDISESFESLANGVQAVKETFWGKKEQKTETQDYVKKAGKAYKVIRTFVHKK